MCVGFWSFTLFLSSLLCESEFNTYVHKFCARLPRVSWQQQENQALYYAALLAACIT
jgi:hypothetical protein